MDFNAFGRYALGQINGVAGNGQGNLTQAAATGVARSLSIIITTSGFTGAVGVGVARGITPNPAALVIGVAGTGVAGTLSSSESDTLPQAVGTGVARALTPSISGFITGAIGTGVAGSLGKTDTVTLSVATGTGLARALSLSVSAFLIGVAGTGVARGFISAAPTAPASFAGGDDAFGRFAVGQISQPLQQSGAIVITVPAARAVGIGSAGIVIGQVTPSALPQAAGTGVAAALTPNPGPPIRAVGEGVAGVIKGTPSGGGGKRKPTGFEPVVKKPQPPQPSATKAIPLPPPGLVRRAPDLVPQDTSPLDLVDDELLPTNLIGLADRISTAQDISDIQRFLIGHDQDQQDADDIADVLALLEHA